jgi:hypothetical protein
VSAGFKSLGGFPLGGGVVTSSPPLAGFRSLLALWLGGGSAPTSSPTPTPTQTNTPGRVRHLPKVKGVERETEAEKLARRIREGTIKAPIEPAPAPDDSAYFKESARLATAIAAARRDAETSRQAIERYTRQAELQRQSEVVQAKLIRAEQALLLAKVQEAVLIEEMEVIDVAFLAHVALKVTLQ